MSHGEKVGIQVNAVKPDAGSIDPEVVTETALENHVNILPEVPLIGVGPGQEQEIFNGEKFLGHLDVKRHVAAVTQEHRTVAQTSIAVVVKGINVVHGVWRPPRPNVHVCIQGAGDGNPTVHVGICIFVVG